MKIEVITTTADPNGGGSGARVHGLVSMLSRFADVRVVLTERDGGSQIPGVEYVSIPVHDSLGSRIARRRTYYRSKFPKRVNGHPPDLVIVESLDLLGLNQYGQGVPMILDEHNVYWDLLRYEILNAPFFRGWLGRRAAVRNRLVPGLLARAKRFELDAIRAASRTLVTSDTDRQSIVAEAPDAAGRVHVLPNCVDTGRIPPLPDSPDSKNVLFVGSFNYVPNLEAAEFIRGSLAPDLPHLRFLLVGPNPPPGISSPNVITTGHAPDLLPVLRDAAICIAPLANGSGTRLKILTYLAAARPVVATAKAVEGLPVRDEEHLLIRDTPQEFRSALRELVSDPDRRRELASAGRKLVESKFDWRVHVDSLRALANEAVAETPIGRLPAA